VIPVEAGRYLATHIPDAKYVVLQGIDHLPVTAGAAIVVEEIEEFLTGSRTRREPDRVLATVLFTDIVGSTERAAELGDRSWTTLLAEHHALVRDRLARFRGKEVRLTGDGFLATFDGPARAIRCACAIRDAVRGLGLEIRAGLHTGEIELADTGVEGLAVHLGARISALAQASEVLVSSTVKDLVVGSDIEFTDRGTHVLKGVPGDWHVHLVTAAG
jgi:class 3 adenylate cyclase